MSAKDITRIPDISLAQRRQLDRYITMFNHGLWPPVSKNEYKQRFAGRPLDNEGKPWTEEDDRNLLRLADEYGVNFGDPWMYLAWDLQRRELDVRNRFIELVVKPY